ncbi:MAG TPA: uridine kinase [Rikenellaceae bacterium]|jgi:uridine kinase|nr:uridine kinase [Bacteroidales bacterium]HBG54249.1 uridine kinase [Rikenellaceae bacterium]
MLVIGIAGGTGSGKTTVVNKILERLDEKQITVIPQDSYYKDNSHLPLEKRQELNFDHPQSIDWELMVEHLLRLKSGAAIEQPMYSYITCTRLPESIHTEPTQIIIVEGILIFTDPPLRNCLDMKIFVDADADDRLSRVISRDIVERGRSVNKVLERYEKTVKPMHLQFIEPTKRYADIIIPQGGHNTVAINMLISTIELAMLSR